MSTKTKKRLKQESDGSYILKLVLYLIIGSQWLYIATPHGTKLSIPVGVVVGAIFAMHDHFQIDRKIEYALLLATMLVGYFAQIGMFVSV
ncbi:MAG TPA: hypothetical protein VFN56_02730 [Candidatus Saccharimonadales bacterium]|nr:hypothetical protein [Candidatus Saccharimonadales bacterium]